MSKHDIKGRNLQIDQIETLEEAKVILKSIFSYSEAFVLAGNDLVYADWVNDRIAEGGGGGGTTLPTDVVEALLAANDPDAENPFATISDINENLLGNVVLNPGVLVVNSGTSVTETGGQWRFDGILYNFTGNLTMAEKPTAPNNRYTIITVTSSGTPNVEEGTEGEDPAVPSPANVGDLILQIIYRPHTDPDIVIPVTPPTVYQTQNVTSGNGLYAPIWVQNTEINRSYDFKIGYVFWTSAYSGSNNHHPQNGILHVNFVTNPTDKLIDPTRVRISHLDIEGQTGDFALVQTDTDEVTLFARKTGYHGTHIFDFIGAKNSTVENGLVQSGVYAALPSETTYLSWNGRSYIPTSGTTIGFDKQRSYGFNGTPLTGNLTIAITYADDSIMQKILHNDSVIPNISVPGGVNLILQSGQYFIDEDNFLYLIIDKDNSGAVTRVNYRIVQEEL